MTCQDFFGITMNSLQNSIYSYQILTSIDALASRASCWHLPSIYSYGPVNILQRVCGPEQVTYAPFIYSYGAMKLLGRVEQVRVLHLCIHTEL